MIFTVRFLILTALGIPVIIFFGRTFTPIAVVAGYEILLFSLYLFDWFRLPKLRDLSLERRCDNPMSLGTSHLVQLSAQNHSSAIVRLVMRDEVPLAFSDVFPTVSLTIPAWGEKSASYPVTPTRRGDYEFGNLWVRVEGPSGLAVRQFVANAKARVKVYPNIVNLSAYDLAVKKGRILETGFRPLRMYGQGSDFESLRGYTPDDEYRKIDWKATARRGEPIVQQYQVEKNQNVMIFLDTGRLMTAQIGKISKLDYALNAALLIGYVASKHGDNVGLLLFSDDVHLFVPPKRGKLQVREILEHLYAVSPSLVEPDFAKAFRFFNAKVHRRSLLLVFTDLVESEMAKPLTAYLARLSRHHLGLVAMIRDMDLVGIGESLPMNLSQVYQKAVASTLLMQRERVTRNLESRGTLIVDVPPTALTGALVQRYLDIKLRGRL